MVLHFEVRLLGLFAKHDLLGFIPIDVKDFEYELPSGKRLHNYGKSPFLMGKSTISMAMFNSYVCLPEGNLLP